jgi:predicted anti-sigma-YlaC factor YlaD
MKDKSNKLLPTCKEVQNLCSAALDRDITLVERTRLHLHLLICTACTNANAQMKLLRTAMRNFPLDDETVRDKMQK